MVFSNISSSQKSGTFSDLKTPAPKAKVFQNLNVKQATPAPVVTPPVTATPASSTPQFFSGVNKQGDSFGPSSQLDPSGLPFLDYKPAGADATTTDKTRIAPKFSPFDATTTTIDFSTPRAVANKAALRKTLGGAYSDVLDHKIAVALGGSNDPSNLRPEPAGENTDGQLAETLANNVKDGKMSYFDAQVAFAKAKGITVPFTGSPDKIQTSVFQKLKNAGHSLEDWLFNTVSTSVQKPISTDGIDTTKPGQIDAMAAKDMVENTLNAPNAAGQPNGPTVLGAPSKNSIPAPKPTVFSNLFKNPEDVNPADINIKVPFTDKTLAIPRDQAVIPGKTTSGFTEMVANLPSDIIQAIPKAGVTAYEELKNSGQTVDKSLNPVEAALYGNKEYKNVNQDIQDRIANGDGLLSSYLGAISNKTLDIAFGAQIAAQGFRVLAKVLQDGGDLATAEAYKTLGSPASEAELEKNYRSLSHQFHPDKVGGSNESMTTINNAKQLIDKNGLPSAIRVARDTAGSYAEMIGRETKLGEAPFSKPNLGRKVPNAKDINAPRLPGTRAVNPDEVPLGLSTKAVENVGKEGSGEIQSPASTLETISNPLADIEKDIPVQVAIDAHRGTSFDPEKRGQARVADYVDTLKSDYSDLEKLANTPEKKAILDSDFARYRDGYKTRFLSLLGSEGRTISPMISGRGNFPLRSNQTKLQVAANRRDDIINYREQVIGKIRRNLNPTTFTGTSEKTISEMDTKLQELKDLQTKMKESNRIIRSGKNVEAGLKALGHSDESIKTLLTPDYMKNTGYPSYSVTSINNKIKTLEARSKVTTEKRQIANSTGNEDTQVGDNTISKNYDQNRVQIHFKEIPSAELRAKLKSKGFRWSPTNQTWQRVLTNQAFLDAQALIGGTPKPEAPSGQLFKRPVISRITGTPITQAEAKTLISKVLENNPVRLAFTDSLIDDVATGQYTPTRDGLKGILKPLIELYEENGKVSSVDALHEAAHYMFDNLLTDAQKADALRVAKKQMGLYHDLKYKAIGYRGSADERAEEYIADQYAKYKAHEEGYSTGPLDRIFKIIDKVVQAIKDSLAKVKEVVDRMNGPEGRRGFIKNPLADETPEDIVPEKKTKKDYQLDEKANTEYLKAERKADIAEGLKSPELDVLKAQRDALVEKLQNHPAKPVIRLVNPRTGELPEATGKSGSIYGKTGDQLAADQGMTSEEQRAAVSDYRDIQGRLKDINTEIRDKTKEVRARNKAFEAQEKINRMRERGLNHVSDLIDKKEKALAKNKDLIEKQEKRQEFLAQAALDNVKYENAVRTAKMKARTKLGPIDKVRQSIAPLKFVDRQTQEIYKTWKADLAQVEEIKREVEPQIAAIAEKQGFRNDFQEVIDQEARANIQYLREASDDQYTRAKRAGLSLNYIENHQHHVYAQGPEKIKAAIQKYLEDQGLEKPEAEDVAEGNKDLSADVALKLKINPNFIKARTFPDYKTAMKYGLTPRYKTPSQLIAYNEGQLQTALANRKFLDTLVKEHKLLPPMDAPRDWSYVKTPFSNEEYKASPELSKVIEGIFRNEDNLSLGQSIWKGVAASSRLLQEVHLSGGIGNVNFFSMGQAIKDLTTAVGSLATGQVGEAARDLGRTMNFIRANFNGPTARFFEANKDYFRMMAIEGLDNKYRIGGLDDKSFKDVWNMMKSGDIKDAIGTGYNKVFNEKTFQAYMPMQNVTVFKSVYEGARAKGVDPITARKFAADTTRNFFGIIKDQGRSKDAEDVLSATFFAPKFRESLINFFVNNAKAFSTGFKDKAFMKNRQFVAGAILSFALYDYINKKNTGHHIWENGYTDLGNALVKIPQSVGRYLPGYQDGDVVKIPFLPSIGAFARLALGAVYATEQGDLKTATQQAGGLFSMPVQITTQILSNQDYFGRPIYKDTDTRLQKVLKIGQYIGLQANHPYVQAVVNQIENKYPLYQTISNAFELPVRFTNMDKLATNQYFNAMAEQTKKQAQALDAFRSKYTEIRNLKAEGNTAESDKLFNSLTDDEHVMYQHLKTAEKAANTRAANADIYDVYQQVQDLKAQGKETEADAIFNSLSPAQHKAYEAAKKKFGR